MHCELCGQGGARLRKVSESFGKGQNLLVIENVPMISCPHCCKSYFTPETLHKIEGIKRHPQNTAVTRLVDVANYM